MKTSEWLARLFGIHGSAAQQRVERERARQQLTEAIDRLRQELRNGRSG